MLVSSANRCSAHLPQTNSIAVAATAIRRDQKARGLWIDWLSHLPPPAADAVHGELRRVVINTHAYPALVGSQIVHTIRRGFSKCRIDEIVHAHLDRRFLLLPFLASVLEITHQLFLLRIHTDDRLTDFAGCLHLCVQELKLCIPVRMPRAFTCLAYALERIALTGQ